MFQAPDNQPLHASLVVVQQFLIAYDLCIFIYEDYEKPPLVVVHGKI